MVNKCEVCGGDPHGDTPDHPFVTKHCCGIYRAGEGFGVHFTAEDSVVCTTCGEEVHMVAASRLAAVERLLKATVVMRHNVAEGRRMLHCRICESSWKEGDEWHDSRCEATELRKALAGEADGRNEG